MKIIPIPCIIFLATLAFTSGCAPYAKKITGNPQETITVEEAFRSVGKGLRVLDDAKGDRMFGIVASDISITFDISSKATNNRGANIAVPVFKNESYFNSGGEQPTTFTGGGSPEQPLSTTLGSNTFSAHSKIVGNRSNRVTVKFKSVVDLIKDLPVEKIQLLKEIGFFKIGHKDAGTVTVDLTNNAGKTESESIKETKPEGAKPEGAKPEGAKPEGAKPTEETTHSK